MPHPGCPGNWQNNVVRIKEGKRPTSSDFASASPCQALVGSADRLISTLPPFTEKRLYKASVPCKPCLVSNKISGLPLEGLQ